MSFNDMAITAKIKANLASDNLFSATDIDIDTENGVVTLHGKVPDANLKNKAEQVAKGIGGVKEVHNELNIS